MTIARRVALWTGQRLTIVGAALAAGLVGVSYFLPFWSMTLRAPQYPRGLRMVAYGTQVVGDLREINIINHYIGMEHIDSVPAPEMSLFPYAIAGLLVVCLLAPLHRRLRHLAIVALAATPVAILADLQLWLHRFGRNLDPRAPIDVEPFTPLSVGVSTIGNFESTGMVSWGFFALLAAALVLWLTGRAQERRAEPAAGVAGRRAPALAAAVLVVLAVVPSAGRPVLAAVSGGELPVRVAPGEAPVAAKTGSVPIEDLQARVDAAPAGATLVVEEAVFHGRLVVDRPLRLVGRDRPVLDGGGEGSVVTISADDVVFAGFRVRNSGRAVTQEAAGVKVTGSRVEVRDNVVEDVYFGIHLAGGRDNVVQDNRIRPGHDHGARPGHAVSAWNQRGTRISGNVIREARDGIYLTFADDLTAVGNDIRGSRYGVHSMYSERSRFVGNVLEDNLLGAALMYSNGLEMRCNRVQRNRRGATAYGLLLKDIDGLVVERNLIVENRVGIYADSTPLGKGREALVRDNVIGGNESALALQSNVGLTFYGNSVVDNLIDVRPEGAGVSAASRWERDGRGNHWDRYRGFDRDGDGIGDLPHRYEQVMNELVGDRPLSRAFLHTPASLALERALQLFPLYRPSPLVVDPRPLMSPAAPRCEEDLR